MTLLIVSRLVVPTWAPNLKSFIAAIEVTEASGLAFSATIDWLNV